MTTTAPRHRLRRLAADDVDVVAGFEAEIAKISFPEDPITDLEFYARKLERLIDDRNAAGIVAVAEDAVVGWASVSRRTNFITKEPYADFHSIFVAASHRGTTVVADLVDAVFRFCRERRLERVVFRTRATNEPMKAVLARFGFEPKQIYYEKALEAAGDGAAPRAQG